MALKFNKVKQDTFDKLQYGAGLLLKKFDVTGTQPMVDTDIISATTGGINATCVPTYIDFGEDVDNAPKNVKEFKKLDTWECKMATTLFGADLDTIKLMLGAADSASGKVTPRTELKDADFADLWWVGDRADGATLAICLKNALSDAGFSLQTTDQGKGQFAFSATGHVSMTAQDVVPMEFYVAEKTI